MTASNRTVFAWMVREEYRLHATMFGGRRFAAFPLFVAAMAAGAAELLAVSGTDVGSTIAGLHALVFAFGLHTGSIGFVGRDAARNLVPTGTLLVFSGRTLPLSRKRLVGVFLAKDAAFYGLFFLVPLTLGFAPSVAAGRLPATALPTLWLSVAAMFVLGVAVTFAAIALSSRGVPGRAVLLGGAAAVGLAWVGVPLVEYTPYAVYAGPDPLVAGLATAGAVGVLLAAGLATYDPTHESGARTADDAFRRWHDRLPLDRGLLAKTLIDVSRSSGGVGKVFFSGAILFAVGAYLIDFAGQITGVDPSTGVSFGAILGLTAFTTYNWLTGVDSLEEYLAYPVDVADVFRAKFHAFLLLGPAVGLAYLALAVAWLGSPLGEAVAGVAVLGGLQLYLFGVIVYLTGFSPNEFLFDTVLFAVFGLAVAVATVPLLLVGFVLETVPPVALVGLALGGAVLAAVGLGLYRRAVGRWRTRHRAGA
jgi:hypothetical protein